MLEPEWIRKSRLEDFKRFSQEFLALFSNAISLAGWEPDYKPEFLEDLVEPDNIPEFLKAWVESKNRTEFDIPKGDKGLIDPQRVMQEVDFASRQIRAYDPDSSTAVEERGAIEGLIHRGDDLGAFKRYRWVTREDQNFAPKYLRYSKFKGPSRPLTIREDELRKFFAFLYVNRPHLAVNVDHYFHDRSSLANEKLRVYFTLDAKFEDQDSAELSMYFVKLLNSQLIKHWDGEEWGLISENLCRTSIRGINQASPRIRVRFLKSEDKVFFGYIYAELSGKKGFDPTFLSYPDFKASLAYLGNLRNAELIKMDVKYNVFINPPI